jgi:hypothetical protein
MRLYSTHANTSRCSQLLPAAGQKLRAVSTQMRKCHDHCNTDQPASNLSNIERPTRHLARNVLEAATTTALHDSWIRNMHIPTGTSHMYPSHHRT